MSMIRELDRLLLCVGLAHGLLALVCALLLRVDATPILGLHPALKPLKFAFSIALFLITTAVLLPSLSVSDTTRRGLSALLAVTMVAEMTVIGAQALRGRRSHFNLEQPLDSALVRVMLVGIVVLLLVMVGIAVIATARPLRASDALTMSGLMTAAWRAALWLFLFAAVSGLGMGGRLAHTVGGADGGPGMALTNWSTTHGDLRVSHFFALHSLQIIPLAAVAISRLPLGGGARWGLLALTVCVNGVLALWTLLQALAARPVW